jgi:hypothetical protein
MRSSEHIAVVKRVMSSLKVVSMTFDNGIENKHHILSILLLLEKLNIKDENQTIITETTNFIDYTMVLIQRFLQSRLFINDMTNTIPYEIRLYSAELTIDYIETNLKSAEKRRELIEEGSQKMREWIEEKIELKNMKK